MAKMQALFHVEQWPGPIDALPINLFETALYTLRSGAPQLADELFIDFPNEATRPNLKLLLDASVKKPRNPWMVATGVSWPPVKFGWNLPVS